ncbi:hypothetical protein EDC04DRAFT_2614534 [Pisolithus marmoratus]|nr:hypothetical protein EDC04DRAFT_2614534 [Pisolithus marmoratus]
MLQEAKDEAGALLNEIRRLNTEHPDGHPGFVGGCPVRCIRKVQNDGTDIFIGYVTVHRGVYADVLDETERQIVTEENNKKTAGDPSIRWSIRLNAFLKRMDSLEWRCWKGWLGREDKGQSHGMEDATHLKTRKEERVKIVRVMSGWVPALSTIRRTVLVCDDR